MNLLYVTSSFPYGPGEAFLLPEVEELLKQGHSLHIVPMLPRGGVTHRGCEGLLGMTIKQPLASPRVLTAAARQVGRSLAPASRALRLAFTPKPRHLMKNLLVYPKGLWLAGLAQELKVEHIHVHWAAATATMGMIASEISGIRWSLTAHRWDIVEDNLLLRKISHSAFARFISRSGLSLAKARGLSETDGIFVLGMGVEIPPRRAAADAGERGRPFRILCPASLQPVKGHRYLLDAIKQVDGNLELWLAGRGRLRKTLEARVMQLGLGSSVTFLGQLPHEQLVRLYQQGEIDAVVLPSVDLGKGVHEGIPVSLIEAMAYGVPVISTETGGIPELLRDGAGLVVPPKDAGVLALAIGELAGDRSLAQRLSEAGRARVVGHHSAEKIVAELATHFLACRDGSECSRNLELTAGAHT